MSVIIKATGHDVLPVNLIFQMIILINVWTMSIQMWQAILYSMGIKFNYHFVLCDS